MKKREKTSAHASPFLRHPVTVEHIMRDVVIALLPAVAFSIYTFGLRVLPYYIISLIIGIALDYLCRKVRTRKRYRFDYSVVVTALLLAMSLPGNVPLWFPIIGMVIAIVVAKELFGGIGKNFLNPAIAGRFVLRLVFVQQMTQNIWPRLSIPVPEGIDAVTGATPLMLLVEGDRLTNAQLWASFLGNTGGKIGETSAVLLLVGAAYLLYRNVIRARIPFTLIGTIALIAWMFGGDGLFRADLNTVIGHVLGGATILAAFYMATDYSSSLAAPLAQYIFAIGIGIITMLFRFYSEYSEGLTFAIIIMNCTVPLMNRYIHPRVVGEKH